MPTIRTAAIAATCALACSVAPAHAATVAAKDADGNCKVTFTAQEKEFAKELFDAQKSLGDHEHARDIVATVESVYPGVMEITERGLKADKPEVTEPPITAKDRKALSKLGMPSPLINAYVSAHATLSTTKPTTNITLEDIDVDSWKVGKAETAAAADPTFPVKGLDAKLEAELNEMWLATPTGTAAKMQADFDKANAAATKACADGKSAEVAFPDAKVQMDKPEKPADAPGSTQSDSPNIPAIVGGVIAAVLVVIGIIAALPQLGMALPFM